MEYNLALKEKGYVGVNPSKFPNIMSATPLSRIAIEIGAKGPCVPLLSSKINKHALMYACEQITAGRCQAMMLIHITKRNDCFGCFIEEEHSCQKRGIKPRLIYKRIS
jgi:3-oxoacyl-(acyl-carrier-protein) synthase